MKLHLLTAFLIFASIGSVAAQTTPNPMTIAIVRMFTKEIFDLNSVPYVNPMIITMNSTSNSGFFHRAYIPEKVDKPYFRFGVETMFGFVRTDQKTYTPQIPTSDSVRADNLTPEMNITLGKIIGKQALNAQDTVNIAAFSYLIIKSIFKDELKRGVLNPPKSAPTIFGSKEVVTFSLPKDSLISDLHKNTYYQLIQLAAPGTTMSIDSAFAGLPASIPLAIGGDLKNLFAAVPQLEIGSWHGTELLLRFIPPVKFEQSVGKFSFWGAGLRHSLSQYFPRDLFDMAVQAVYQRTSIANTIGATNSELTAKADIWDFNLQASKHWGNLDVFTALSVENINIDASYKYTLSLDLQQKLGIINQDEIDHGISKDDQPQTTSMLSSNTNIKWIIGASYQIGKLSVFADYSLSQFNIFAGGVNYQF